MSKEQVERSELPPELQPQNRFFGKVRAFINGQPIYGENKNDKNNDAEVEETSRLEDHKEIELGTNIDVNVHNDSESERNKNAPVKDSESENDGNILSKNLNPEIIEIEAKK